jgi:hypothetical protein
MARKRVTRVRHIECNMILVVLCEGGFTKFGTTPGGGIKAGVSGVIIDGSIVI